MVSKCVISILLVKPIRLFVYETLNTLWMGDLVMGLTLHFEVSQQLMQGKLLSWVSLDEVLYLIEDIVIATIEPLDVL
jgi:hypothetical protein